jgi:hypothetical protein
MSKPKFVVSIDLKGATIVNGQSLTVVLDPVTLDEVVVCEQCSDPSACVAAGVCSEHGCDL